MTIYVDVLFLENLILDSIILYAATIIAKIKVKHLRIWGASSLGALYVIIYYVFKIKIYTDIFAKLLLTVCMIYIAFRPQKWSELLKYLVIFFLVSFVFGGASLGVIYIVNSNNVTIVNGMIQGKYTINTILLGIIIAFIICMLAFKIVKTKFDKKNMICKIKIYLDEKEVETRAMIDTGNLLKEPITNIPVVVVESTVMKEVLPMELLENIENILGGDVERISKDVKDKYLSRLKVIPFSSLGKQNGMLLGIKADLLITKNEEEEKRIDKVIIGIYNMSISKKGEYRALLGLDVL